MVMKNCEQSEGVLEQSQDSLCEEERRERLMYCCCKHMKPVD